MTLSPFLDLPLVRSPPPSFPFSLSGIFEFRRFHVTERTALTGGKGERTRVERGQYLYWTRERVSESSRGISSGNLQGPGRGAKRHGRLMPRAIVASLVSCPGDRMPIGERRRRRWEERGNVAVARSRDRLQDAEGSKEDAVGIRNGLRNQMG